MLHTQIKGWPWTSQELHFVPLRMCSRRWVQLCENSVQRRKIVRTFIPHSFTPPCSTGRMRRGQIAQRTNGTQVRAQAEGLPLAEPECWLQLEQGLVGSGFQVKSTCTLRFKSLNLENLHPAYSISVQQSKLSPGVCQSLVLKLVPGRSKPCCIYCYQYCYHAVVGRPH